MKFRIRKHTTAVLTGAEARNYLSRHYYSNQNEVENHWASAVAVCTCGWFTPCIHGEAAEAEALHHAGIRPLAPA